MHKYDLISRSALLDRIGTATYYSIDPYNQRGNIFKMVATAPDVDAEIVRHGRWVHPEKSHVVNLFVCSECGHAEASYRAINRRPNGVTLADENGNFYYPPNMNYCSHCGAKMDAEGMNNGST